jgi:hypothetical protein
VAGVLLDSHPDLNLQPKGFAGVLLDSHSSSESDEQSSKGSDSQSVLESSSEPNSQSSSEPTAEPGQASSESVEQPSSEPEPEPSPRTGSPRTFVLCSILRCCTTPTLAPRAAMPLCLVPCNSVLP